MFNNHENYNERGLNRPVTPRTSNGSSFNTTQSPIADDIEEEDDDLALPGSLNDDILNQKFKRLQEAAQHSRPTSIGGMGIVQSSRPISARGARPSSSAGVNSSSTGSILATTISTPRNHLGSHAPATNPLKYSSSASSVPTPRAMAPLDRASSFYQDTELLEDLSQLRSSRQAALELESQLKDKGIVSSFDPTQHQDSTLASQLPPPTYRQTSRPRLDLSDRRKFITIPPPLEYGFVRCYITRDRSKLNKVFPRYYLWHEDSRTFLLSAKKRKKNKSSNYTVSLDDKDMGRNSGSFFGKLRSNFIGTEFTMYDKGESSTNGEKPNTRKQIGAISYETNILGSKGPRKLCVITPDVGPDGKHYDFPELANHPTIMDRYKTGHTEKLRIFKNKSPVWNEKLKAYVLNFNGRVTKASVKNFQLCDVSDPGKTYLQFGKVDKDRFTLDFRYPISGMQAFCVALSAFDSKLACE